jgi:acetylornithine deacetylase/succinyl-diaminopimelate desuccinylase-like protein
MELLCIKDSWCNQPNAILVYEGCRYNLEEVVKGLFLYGTNNNIWYRLLETGVGTHHSSLFAVAPPVIEEITQQIKENGETKRHQTEECHSPTEQTVE